VQPVTHPHDGDVLNMVFEALRLVFRVLLRHDSSGQWFRRAVS
jgi:hypothetical protein